MELHLGFMSIADIAEWFGITKRSYAKARDKKLKILSTYCEFTVIPHRGINITRIYDSSLVTYSKVRDVVETKAEELWKEGEWNTGANIGREIYESNTAVSKQVKEETVIAYTGQWKRSNYGVAYLRRGLKGICSMTFTIEYYDEEDQRFHYRELTPEEKEIKDELFHKYFDYDKEKEFFIIDAWLNKETTIEEMTETLTILRKHTSESHAAFLTELQSRIGPVKKATKLEGMLFFDDETIQEQ